MSCGENLEAIFKAKCCTDAREHVYKSWGGRVPYQRAIFKLGANKGGIEVDEGSEGSEGGVGVEVAENKS